MLSLALAIMLAFGFTFSVAPAGAVSAVATASVDYTSYDYSDEVGGLTVTFYSDIYSRGFCWVTADTNSATELYVVKSSHGENATFITEDLVPSGNTYTEQLSDSGKNYYTHKAHVTGLTPGATYSYKVGGNGHYRYGTFKVEDSEIDRIDIISLTDAQTRNLSLLNVWENTAAQSIGVVQNPDLILYDGDQFDVSGRVKNSRILAYCVALDTVSTRFGATPYMAALGNHDYGTSNARSDVDFANSSDPGYYSFDYGFAHFVVLNINGNGDSQSRINAQLQWLPTDLAAARANANIKWIVVMMHNGPHSTGDHSADTYTPKGAAMFTPIFSQYHVDLVIQGHDHTYSKTLPYKWDTEGKTTVYGDSSIVNYSVLTETVGSVTYDVNPQGTYYVTTGAAGHRAGATAGEADGVYADVVADPGAADGSGLAPVNSVKTYLNNTYKTIVGICNVGCSVGTSTVNKGDPATCNIDSQMFGSLSITPTTLSYKFYVVDGANVMLLDTLDVMKYSEAEASILATNPGAENASDIKDLLDQFIDDLSALSANVIQKLRDLVDSVATFFENEWETIIGNANSSSNAKVNLLSVQSSEVAGGTFNLRLIAGTSDTKENLPTVGFYVYKNTGSGYGEKNELRCTSVYTSKVEADSDAGFANEKTVADMNGGNLYALTLKGIPSDGTIKLKVQPYGVDASGNTVTGNSFIIEIRNGFVKSVDAG